MRLETLRQNLDDLSLAQGWLTPWGITDVKRAHANIVRIAESGVPLDLLARLADLLAEHLPAVSDPDMALNNLERFLSSNRSPLALATLFDRDPHSLAMLLQILSTSQYLSNVLVTDTESYELLRLTEGLPVNREMLVDEIAGEIERMPDEAAALASIRRFKHRETLRIAHGDLTRAQPVRLVTEQISNLADAIVEGALRWARRRLEASRGQPMGPNGKPARFAILGMGKLGGAELNYSSDIDLIFLYDADGRTNGARPVSNEEFYDRLSRDLVRLLTENTDRGIAYRVDLRLRPEGERGPIVHSLDRALQYYDVLGRTWERQAYVKARAVSGDLDFGAEFLARLEPWIYRRYLGLADIAGIKALKRRIEGIARNGGDARNVKTGHGGIRDIEFAIQFLQLLNGGDLPALRTSNTLEAIGQLERCGCLTHQERTLLAENYEFLRKIEHRLQIMFDLQTHVLPESAEELQKLALRMGYVQPTDKKGPVALDAFEADYQQKTAENRKILNHLLHDAFDDDAAADPEVDLVLDPDPPRQQIEAVLGRYPFRDLLATHRSLVGLATERIRFLSTRRCRHFLASIAPRLLKAVAATPDPDAALLNLERVSDSLGGKGVLWELFSFNPPSMNLYVELCANSPLLSTILTSNPGMIDELMDSLVVNRLPTSAELRATLAEMCRGAEDIEPMLHSFRNAELLRVGVRDILGKEGVRATMAALTDIAEVCLERIAAVEYEKLVRKWGEPRIGAGDRAGETCEMAIVAMGKLGGRELNYGSDLDLIFLYEADGVTSPTPRHRRVDSTNNQHFFSELAQRIIKTASKLGPQGKLYEVDPRLRPTGKSGSLALSFAEFARYYSEGHGQLWERQSLCKARPIATSPAVGAIVEPILREAAYGRAWEPGDAETIREMRARLEASTSATSLKRGPGGAVDIEFLVQMLQLKYGREYPALQVTNTEDVIRALHTAGLLTRADFEFLTESYRFLLSVRSRLRLLNATSRNELPSDAFNLAKLAHGTGYADAEQLRRAAARFTEGNRSRFDAIFAANESAGAISASAAPA